MATLVTRAGKGSALTHNEVDANFTNLNTDKAELSGAAFTGNVDFAAGVDVTGNITVTGTVDGRDIATDGSKLDGIEASADVTDTANVTSAGALMDSELTALASVKAINQGLATTDSPTFAAATVNGNIVVTGTVDGRDIAANIPSSLGSAGQFLAVNSGASATEWVDAPAAGTHNFTASGACGAAAKLRGGCVGITGLPTNNGLVRSAGWGRGQGRRGRVQPGEHLPTAVGRSVGRAWRRLRGLSERQTHIILSARGR